MQDAYYSVPLGCTSERKEKENSIRRNSVVVQLDENFSQPHKTIWDYHGLSTLSQLLLNQQAM